jgi:phosphohistidine swiveling domain-containing protein
VGGFALGTDQIISDKLKILYDNSKLKEEISFNELFSILTAPIHLSFINEAEVSLIKIVIEAKKDPKKRMELLTRHQNDFFWIHNNYVDAYVLSVEYFNEELDKMLKMDTTLISLLEKIQGTPKENKLNKIKYWDFVLQDKELAFLLTVSEDFTKWQDDRKKATLWTMHYGSLILSEICKRVGVSLHLIKYMSPREVSKIFINTPSEELLNERKKNSVFYWDKDGHEVLTGKDADEIRDAILKVRDFSDINDFRGMTACMGKISGRVKIVKSVKEIGKVEQGDILVAVMTRPDYVPAMKKAAAIVTDEGGITSHAAIVSREMKIPCIIGTKMATKVLKDGDLVEVNANHGMVKIIRNLS